MKCTANGCDQEAVFRCFWPGQTVVQCKEHKEGVVRVGEAMGFKVEFEYVDQAAYEADTRGEVTP